MNLNEAQMHVHRAGIEYRRNVKEVSVSQGSV